MLNKTFSWPVIIITLLAAYGLVGFIMFWSLAKLSVMADGLVMFDLRPLGYSYADAQAIVSNLGEEGRHFYLTTQFWLDCVYPAVNAFAILSLISKLTNHYNLRSLFKALLLLVPLVTMLLDYCENYFIGQMLYNHDNLSPILVAQASLTSLIKSMFSTLSSLIMMVLLAIFIRGKINKTFNAV